MPNNLYHLHSLSFVVVFIYLNIIKLIQVKVKIQIRDVGLMYVRTRQFMLSYIFKICCLHSQIFVEIPSIPIGKLSSKSSLNIFPHVICQTYPFPIGV